MLAGREADPAARSWELEQARRDRDVARRAVQQLDLQLERSARALEGYHFDGLVGEVGADVRGAVAVDTLDKRVYWLEQAAVWRAHLAPAGAVVGAARVLARAASRAGLLLHRPSARLYWTEHEGAR